MARAIIRYSLDNDQSNITGNQVRKLLEEAGFERSGPHCLRPTICRKWIQSPYAIDHRRDKLVPTIVGEAVNLPDGVWEWLEDRLQRTEITRVTGRPRAAATDLPTWHLEIVTAAGPHRVHAYGAGVSSVVYGNHEVDPGLRAVNLAISTIEQFAGRIPWTERLELQAVKPTNDQMADLLA